MTILKLSLGRLISLLFLSTRNCFTCGLSFTSNEYFDSFVVLNIENHNAGKCKCQSVTSLRKFKTLA